MSVFTICFSPTGGTQKALGLLAGAFPAPIALDLSDPGFDGPSHPFSQGDLCFFAVPSFGGRVPDVAVQRIRTLQGNGAYAVLLVSYGNRAYEDTLLELKDEVSARGFRPIAAAAAVAEHSIMRQFATGRPDSADEAELREFSGRIRALVESAPEGGKLQVPGNLPYRAYGGVPLKPKAGKACTRCGACAKLCPVGAIPKEDPAGTDTGACISCMRCIAVCPSHARALNSVMLGLSSQKLKNACSGRKPNQLFTV